MKTVKAELIKETVKKMCIEANCNLPEDIYRCIRHGLSIEESSEGKKILSDLIENANYAKEQNMPICQDTGMAVFFVSVGQEVYIDGNLTEAINGGVRDGYEEGYLRKSVVIDPLRRVNTKDNTPAVIHYDIVPGDKIEITFAPKGFGSENMGGLKMLKPSDGEKGVMDFVVKTVEEAGPNPCPPIVVGVGIGGTMEKAALLAKKALTREADSKSEDEYYAAMEEELLHRINSLGIGPQGLGGRVTALGVNIETFPSHIAGLAVCVNIGCHVTRHLTKTL
ncbi:MAG: fumarate hydratase [Bacillota bacterium]|nr:fumarate hydratase [Bacillota bacterium]